MTYFKKADWVLEQLGVDGTVIVDARYALNDTEAGKRAYAEAHIPGAYYLNLSEDLSSPKRPNGEGGRHPLPEPRVLADILERIGIGNHTTVIVLYKVPTTSPSSTISFCFSSKITSWLSAWDCRGNNENINVKDIMKASVFLISIPQLYFFLHPYPFFKINIPSLWKIWNTLGIFFISSFKNNEKLFGIFRNSACGTQNEV